MAIENPILTIFLQGVDIIGASLNHKTDMERSRSATGLRPRGNDVAAPTKQQINQR